mgnify:CR=1 FL=1
MKMKGVFFMHICRYCGERFLPPQTFKNLFRRPTVCKPCGLLSEHSLRLERIPIQGNELILFTHDHAPHPVLTADVFRSVVREHVHVLFIDSLKNAPKAAFRILSGLFQPVVIYHPEFPTLDRLERFIGSFDDEV